MDSISENKAGQGVLPPVPVFEIPCEKCTGDVPLEEGKIPVRCPHCGYYLRPENDSMWSHFCFVLRHRYASWKGRCTRKEIWSFILFSHLILLLPAFLSFLILDSRVPSCSCAAGHAGPFYIAILIATIIYIPLIFASSMQFMSLIPKDFIKSTILRSVIPKKAYQNLLWFSKIRHLLHLNDILLSLLLRPCQNVEFQGYKADFHCL